MSFRLHRILLACFIVCFFLAAGSYIVYSQNVYYLVRVNGAGLGYVTERAEVEGAVGRLKAESESEAGLETMVVEEIEYEKVNTLGRVPILAEDVLRETLRAKLTFMTHAIAVVVDGREVTALRNRKEAEEVLARLTEQYRERITAKGNTSIQNLEINQDVQLIPRTYLPDQVVDVDTAAQLLARGTDQVKNHLVAQGENLWTIARAHGVGVEELQRANPQLPESFLIRPGDSVSLVVPEPYITFSSQETYTYSQRIPFSTQVEQDAKLWPWQRKVKQAGVYGEKEITVSIARSEEREVGREVLAERVLSEPQTQIVVQGTRQIPERATGRLAWPTSGGSVSSGFGYRRSEYHKGVDIAVSWGTPAKAADAGVVTSTGWRGGYGLAIEVDHGRGRFVTLYAHLSSVAVKVGQNVDKGQVIGRVGNTGRSTGPHLHFEVHLDGSAVNPLQFYQ